MATKIRILYVIPSLNPAGIERYVFEICKLLDKSVFDIDIVSHNWQSKNNNKDNNLKHQFEELGARVYSVTDASVSFMRFLTDVRQFFKRHNNYDIVHVHPISAAVFFLWYSYRAGIKNRIFHVHEPKLSDKFFHKLRNVPLVAISKKLATSYFAVSQETGKALFKNRSFQVVFASIDKDMYKFNNTYRSNWRNKLGFSNSDFVIGSVGRLCKQKNYIFLINVFNKYRKINSNAKLVICGDGPEKKKIENNIKKLNLQDHVKLTGLINNVNEIYSAFDCFVLPSLYEGLGMVLVEAQFSGLRCVASNNVPKAASVGQCKFVSLNNINSWVQEIDECKNKDRAKVASYTLFDTGNNVKLLSRLYLEMV